MAQIKIDASDTLIVLVCESCGGTWRACAWSKAEAHVSAVAHERRAHRGENHAYKAQSDYLYRLRGGGSRRAATRR